MQAYNNLDVFPDVGGAMSQLTTDTDIEAWIFSNGTRSMIVDSLTSSADLSEPLKQDVLSPSRVVSIDAIGVYKPNPRSYELMAKTVGYGQEDLKYLWLVSSNPFDIVGARAFGMSAVWVDRDSTGWRDGLGGAMGLSPTRTAKGVDEAVQAILSYSI
jgi:2-haloacid dehalogenase